MKLQTVMIMFVALRVAALMPVSVVVGAGIVSDGFTPFVFPVIAIIAFSYALVTGSFKLESGRAPNGSPRSYKQTTSLLPPPAIGPKGCSSFAGRTSAPQG